QQNKQWRGPGEAGSAVTRGRRAATQRLREGRPPGFVLGSEGEGSGERLGRKKKNSLPSRPFAFRIPSQWTESPRTVKTVKVRGVRGAPPTSATSGCLSRGGSRAWPWHIGRAALCDQRVPALPPRHGATERQTTGSGFISATDVGKTLPRPWPKELLLKKKTRPQLGDLPSPFLGEDNLKVRLMLELDT
uniref:Uncharacterized protein n=1 Tax=Mustela putorius furo TaxID=9669 RepID=M3Y3J4_MUSPF